MARKLYYKIQDDGENFITDEQWDEILRLQHWYNSEFIWTAGKLTFKMFAVFQNPDALESDETALWQRIIGIRKQLAVEGMGENQIIRYLEQEGLIIVKKGGYTEGCIASGMTRIANNEWNAYLVCEFLLKTSLLIPQCSIQIEDEGVFIKPHSILIKNGEVIIPLKAGSDAGLLHAMAENKRVFSTVDPAKYDNQTAFKTTVASYNALDSTEQKNIISDWNWLGFEQNYDRNGDDIQGVNLNQKVHKFFVR